uniref:Uncharacterized protein n=1 Tax=Octopus bimaculoides TaxID=37653 RepID=A0A0L8G023_OCTBM
MKETWIFSFLVYTDENSLHIKQMHSICVYIILYSLDAIFQGTLWTNRSEN